MYRWFLFAEDVRGTSSVLEEVVVGGVKHEHNFAMATA